MTKQWFRDLVSCCTIVAILFGNASHSQCACFVTYTKTVLPDGDDAATSCACRYIPATTFQVPFWGCPVAMVGDINYPWYRNAVKNEAGNETIVTGRGKIGTYYICRAGVNYGVAIGCAAALGFCAFQCAAGLVGNPACVGCIIAYSVNAGVGGCRPCNIIACSQDPDGIEYMGTIVKEVNTSCYGEGS